MPPLDRPDRTRTVPLPPRTATLACECDVFHSFASRVVQLGANEGVVFETKSGPLVLSAEVVVDCTGDGDVAAAAGAPYSPGRDPDARALRRVGEPAP